MEDLGSRIRQLRKERKLTLAQLAGDRLTKGMLSLIENGKAQPSMESLYYIAQQLQVDMSSLLGEEVESFKELMLEVEEMRNTLANDKSDSRVIAQNIIDKVTPIVDRLQKNRYEHIRIREIYSNALAIITGKLDEQIFYEIMDCYEAIHAYSRLLNCYSFLSWYAYDKKKFNESLELLLHAEQRIEPYWLLIDDISRITLFHNLMVMYYAVSDGEKGSLYKEKVLEIARRKKIYYQMDGFYHILFIQAISDYQFEESTNYFKKLQLINQLVEEEETNLYYLFCRAHYLNTIEKNHDQVLHFLQEEVYTQEGELFKSMEVLYKMEESIALYHLEKYEQALAVCENVKIPKFFKHPLDLNVFYRFVAYRALMYQKLGDHESAKRDILYAANGVESYPANFYTSFIRETYDQIMK